MNVAKQVTITITGLMGTATPFRQGGSLRIVLPRKIARAYNIVKLSSDEIEEVTFFFIGTDIGVLMCTLSDLSKNEIMQELVYSRH